MAASQIHPNELRGCQEKDGLEARQPPAKKRRKEPAVSANKKWSWRDEHVEALIGYMKDYKSLCDFNGIDFEADYRTAVNKGTRSGSGKIVKEHFDILCEIWGGSPATTMLAEGVDGDSLTVTSDSVENEETDRGFKDSNEEPEPIPSENKDLVDSVQTCSKKNAKVSVSVVPRLVDNKRKQMEKALSQSKRDQILMNSAKEDLIMKKQMIASLEDSNKSLQSSMQKMTESLSAMAEGISSGMRMIAMAMSGPTQQHFQPFHPPDYSSHGMMYQSNMYGSPRGYNSPVPEFSGQGSGRSHTPSPTPSESASSYSVNSTYSGHDTAQQKVH